MYYINKKKKILKQKESHNLYANLNKKVLTYLATEAHFLISRGKSFHNLGPAIEKALSPYIYIELRIDALSQNSQLPGLGNLQVQETNGFDEAFVELSYRWENSEERGSYSNRTQLANKCLIHYSPNNKYHNKLSRKYFILLNSKQMPNKCFIT